MAAPQLVPWSWTAAPFSCYETPRKAWCSKPTAAHNGGTEMAMHTPSAWTFWLSLVLVVLAIIATFIHIPFITMYAFWVAVIGYVVLVIGCTLKTA
jgi:hypothetical protein